MASKKSKPPNPPRNPTGRPARARGGGPTRILGARFSNAEIDELNHALEKAAEDPNLPYFANLSDYIRWCMLPSLRKKQGK